MQELWKALGRIPQRNLEIEQIGNRLQTVFSFPVESFSEGSSNLVNTNQYGQEKEGKRMNLEM